MRNGETVPSKRSIRNFQFSIFNLQSTFFILYFAVCVAVAQAADLPQRPPEATDEFVPLCDGHSFAGWKFPAGFEGHWVARDGVISYDGKGTAKEKTNKNLWTEKEFGDFVLVAEWRLPAKPVKKMMNDFAPNGEFQTDAKGKRLQHEIYHAGDSGIYLRGSSQAQVNIWSQPMGSGDINEYHKNLKLSPEIRRACMPLKHADKPLGEWNRFVITMKGDRVTVVLNGEKVIDNAELPGVPARGPIALQNHGDPVEFRNLYIKERSQEIGVRR
jgi:hypothetical protein